MVRKVAHGEELSSLIDRPLRGRLVFAASGRIERRTLTQASKALLAPTFQTLVEATHEPFVQAILDLQVKQMVYGRAILLGDAAFVPRPHTAGSTAKAAANALTLATALQSAIPTSMQLCRVGRLNN